MESNLVDLGFTEDQDSWLLTNRFFPSKIGGKAAWLELENIPDAKDLSCDYCNEPCIFLCQIYAAGKESHAFHRSIFVFICKNGKCCSINQSGNIKILRSQLPLKNKFYPDTPADESVEAEEIAPLCKTCNICGCKAPMVCGKCKKVNYCGQHHQKIDWKTHKSRCGQENPAKVDQSESFLFPEYEIVIESEEAETKHKKESDKEAEARRFREYEELIKGGKVAHNGDITEDDLKELEDSKEDKAFGKFKKAVERYPEQVIRYNRRPGSEPLWISSNRIPNKSNIPKCSNCNGRRTFEFQIMPQMLNDLKNYDLDWGIIAVYTCESDCPTNGKYLQEYCIKQDVTKSDPDAVDIDMENKMDITDGEAKPKEVSKPTITEGPGPSKKPKPSKVEKSNGNKEQTKKAFQECDDW